MILGGPESLMGKSTSHMLLNIITLSDFKLLVYPESLSNELLITFYFSPTKTPPSKLGEDILLW